MKDRKREKFVEMEKKRGGFEFKPAYIIPLFVIIGAVAFFVMGNGPKPANDIGGVDTGGSGDAKTDPNNYYIPVSEINEGKAHFYKYDSITGKVIRFFVLKSRDGIFRAAFDACDVCFEAKKGYMQEGDYMICNNCGRKFESTRINIEQGGCNPAPLARTMEDAKHNTVPLKSGAEDGYLVIKKSDIEGGARYF